MKILNAPKRLFWLTSITLFVFGTGSVRAEFGPGRQMARLTQLNPLKSITTVKYPSVQQQYFKGTITSLPQSTQPTEISEEITDEITNLARNLENDPKRIFDYVHNYIRYVHYFGSKKGALLTLLEGSGNDFDQCALLVALLRAAAANDPAANNYTVRYQFGVMSIPYESTDGVDLKHWLGLTLPASAYRDYSYLMNVFYFQAGFPLYLGNFYLLLPQSGGMVDQSKFIVHRLWVKLDYGAPNVIYLDPAFKIADFIPGLDISTAMGFNSADFLNSAKAGATVNNNYVQNLNYANISSKLTGYTGTLLTYLQDTRPNLSVEEVISGYKIRESETTSFPGLPFEPKTAFTVYDGTPSDHSVTMPVLEWNNIPTNYMSSLRLQIDQNPTTLNYNVDETYKFPELKARKLSLTFVDRRARISLDDVPDQTGTLNTGYDYAGTAKVKTSVAHPFGTWNFSNNSFDLDHRSDQNDGGLYYYRDAPGYIVGYAFDDPSQLLVRRQQKLNALIRQGLNPTNPQVVTETLNVMGLSWFQQTYLAQNVIAMQYDVVGPALHRVGRIAQERPPALGFYVDIGLEFWALISRSQAPLSANDHRDLVFDVSAFAASAMEHGVIEQLQPLGAASTIKSLYQANANQQKLILATSENANTVATYLQFSPSQNAALLNLIQQPGVTMLLPSGKTPIGSWNGYGFAMKTDTDTERGFAMVISSPNYNGGHSAVPTWIDPASVNDTFLNSPTIFNPASALQPIDFGADPVNMLDGSFTVDSVDLSVGQSEPRGFSFSRHYDTNRRFSNDVNMGFGWTHNYCMKAAELSDPAAALGKTTPQAMAAFLVAMRAASTIYSGIPDASYPSSLRWTVGALIAEWGIDVLKKNAVTITLGKDAIEFIKQPNGTYTPPAGAKMTLAYAPAFGYQCYQLQMRHGDTFLFDAYMGPILWIVDPYGKTMTFKYDYYYPAPAGLKQVVDCWGRILSFTYDSFRRLESVSAGPRSVQFTYGGQTNLTKVTDLEGKIWTYEYDTDHKVTKTKDPTMPTPRIITQNIYDSDGKVTQQLSQGDAAKTWNIYAADNRVSVQKDPKGGRTTYYYDEKQRLVATKDANNNKTSWVYDGQDHVVQSITPKNEVTKFEYDGRQNVTRITDPLNNFAMCTYKANDTLETKSDFHDSQTPAHTTTYTYNQNLPFLVETITAPDVNDDIAAHDIVRFAYNEIDATDGKGPKGTLKSRTDQENKITSFEYDSHGEISKITSPITSEYETFFTDDQGNLKTHTDANGIVTQFEYNNRRQLTKTTVDQSGLNIVTQIAYDDSGNVAKRTDALGNIVTSTYSSTQKLLINQFSKLADGTTPKTIIHYDERDWLDFTENPLLGGGKTSFVYDFGGRQTSVTDPLNRTTIFGYDTDGHKTSVTSPLLDNQQNPIQTTRYGYNERGEQNSLTDAADPASAHPIRYTYDANGKQQTIKNRNGNTFTSTYYGNNQLHTFQTPLLKTTTYKYVQRGMVQSIKKPSDATSPSTTFHYDDRGRLDSKTDPITAPGYTFYGYDKNNNLTSVSENGEDILRTYDHANRLESYKDERDYYVFYYYDKNGNATNIIYPGNRGVTNFYDNLNRLTNITDWASRKTTFKYDIAGRLTSITRPNGTVRLLSYDNAGQLTGIEEMGPQNAAIYSFVASAYDGAGRLAGESLFPAPAAFSAPSISATHNYDNQISTFQGNNVIHDDDGNMTSGPLNSSTPVTYLYNARNQLTSVGGVSYTYDSEGHRLSLTQSGLPTFFVNDSSGNTLIRIRPNNKKTYYIYGPGLVYDVEIDASGNETGTHTYHFDIRGSTIALTDNSSQVIERMSYGPYGALASGTPTTDTPFLFNGRYGVMTDPNGLLFMRARYYNPYICRFISADPARFAGGMNFYAYANGNPVSLIDPFGLGSIAENGKTSWFDRATDRLDAFSGSIAEMGGANIDVQLGLIDWAIKNKIGQGSMSSGGAEGNALPLVLFIATGGESAVAQLLRGTSIDAMAMGAGGGMTLETASVAELGVFAENSALTGKASRELAQSLLELGPKPFPGAQAAHIVPTAGHIRNDAAAVRGIFQAQDAMDLYLPGMRNHGINGFWELPGHSGTHKDIYYRALGQEFGGVASLEDTVRALDNMRARILVGEFR
jgi:RHS repeat-associated protein